MTTPIGKHQKQLNRVSPGTKEAKLGDIVNDLITNYNLLQASYAALAAKYGALLAHLDTANVAGIGNANVATYGAAATTSAQIAALESR